MLNFHKKNQSKKKGEEFEGKDSHFVKKRYKKVDLEAICFKTLFRKYATMLLIMQKKRRRNIENVNLTPNP